MAAPTVTVINPVKSPPGSSGGVPFTANGTATVPSGSPPVTSMTYQINDGPAKSLMPGPSGFSPWSFQLTAQDCPQVNVTYTVTVYAWNSNGMGDDYGNFIRTS
jgi:hypothetical protein